MIWRFLKNYVWGAAVMLCFAASIANGTAVIFVLSAVGLVALKISQVRKGR